MRRGALLAVALLSCGGGTDVVPEDDGAGGSGPEVCEAGGYVDDNGVCREAGIDAEDCPEGFEGRDRACFPVLPAQPCGPGQMALAGETACRPVAACGDGTWGDIPVEASTVYVDATYSGQDADGSVTRPFASVQPAIDAATPGAIVAVAAGEYAADLVLTGKAIRLWGRCPDMVTLRGTGTGPTAALFIRTGADGTEVRDLALRGAAIGLLASGSTQLTLEGLWVHDTASRGVGIEGGLGPTEVLIRGSLVEHAVDTGVYVSGASVTVEETSVRDIAPQPNGTMGRGINIQQSNGGSPSAATIRRVRIERSHNNGIFVAGSTADIEAAVVRDTQPSTRGDGRGISLQDGNDLALPTQASVRASYIERSLMLGLFVAGDTVADIEHVTVVDTLPIPDYGGTGIAIERSAVSGGTASATLRHCTILRSAASGINVAAAQAELLGVSIRTIDPDLAGTLGDGVSVFSLSTDPASASLRGCFIEDAARAGVSNFGSTVRLQDTRLSCHAFALAVEEYGALPSFENLGGNVCGCRDEVDECAAASANLMPPGALGSP